MVNVLLTLAVQLRCVPGTESDVIIIVTHLKRNTVPDIAKKRRRRINLKSPLHGSPVKQLQETAVVIKLVL